MPEPLEFEWNKGNIRKNFQKHGISDKESEEIFNNQPLCVSLDRKHSTTTEVRYHALGKTDENRAIFLSFTVRGYRVRIISARPASRKERGQYGKK